MLEIAKLELRARRRWRARDGIFVVLLSILAVTTTVYSLSLGVRIDRGIYTSNLKLGDPLFRVSKDPDVTVVRGGVILKGTEKSLAAFDELRNYLKRVYDEWLWQRYGYKAFPVMVRLVRVKTKVSEGVRFVKNSTTFPKVSGKGAVEKSVKRESEGKMAEIAPQNVTGAPSKSDFLTPDQLRPPSLLDKILYAFGFVIPIYFVVQIYSSSTAEDKLKRRFEVLFTALSPEEVLFGKMLPYAVASVLLSTIALAILGKSPIYEVYIFPVILFLLALNTFTAMISRSYREMTFLTIVISIFVTVYLFIPAVFSEFTFGGVSPITRILNGDLKLWSYVVSTFQFWSMAVVLFYLSINSNEVMYSQRDPLEKIVELARQTVRDYPTLFLAVFLSIPFVFVIEFFTLSLIFMFEYAVYVVILLIAIVEEFFKGLLIYSAVRNGCNGYVSAIVASIGFFLGEKAVLFAFLPVKGLTYLPVPLIAHTLASLLFVLTLRFGFKRALAVSSAFHAVYDGVIIWSLLR